MLVLERKELERVVITLGDERVVITVVEIKKNSHGRKVRLGFECPNRSVTIHREEIQQRIDQAPPPEGV